MVLGLVYFKIVIWSPKLALSRCTSNLESTNLESSASQGPRLLNWLLRCEDLVPKP